MDKSAIEVSSATVQIEEDQIRFTITSDALDITFAMTPTEAARFGQWLKDEAREVNL